MVLRCRMQLVTYQMCACGVHAGVCEMRGQSLLFADQGLEKKGVADTCGALEFDMSMPHFHKHRALYYDELQWLVMCVTSVNLLQYCLRASTCGNVNDFLQPSLSLGACQYGFIVLPTAQQT